MGGRLGRRSTIVAGASLLGLLAVVALASRAPAPTGGGGRRLVDSDVLLEYVLVLGGAVVVVLFPVSVYFLTRLRREDVSSGLPSRGNWMLSLVVTVACFGALAALLLEHPHRAARPGIPPVVPVGRHPGTAHLPTPTHLDWTPAIAVGVLVVLALGATALAFLRRQTPVRSRRPREVVLAVLERTLADLRAEPDARRAVIAAYAQMERALGDAGLPRRSFEAPREYLGRVLTEVGAGAASIERLTALFERAKFSAHRIDTAMKDEAIDALERVRDELRRDR